MKHLTALLLFLFISFIRPFQAQSEVINLNLGEIDGSWNPNEIARGYIAGTIARMSVRGLVWKTLEGSLMVGERTAIGPLYDIECVQNKRRSKATDFNTCQILTNPWPFSSFDTPEIHNFMQFSGRVLFRYASFAVLPILESHNLVHEIFAGNPEVELPIDQLEVKDLHLHYGEGYISGRIVKASLEGVVRRQYQVILQGRNSTDEFYAMSLRSRSLFNFLVMTMYKGQTVRLHYQNLYAPQALFGKLIGYTTRYLVFGAELEANPTNGR